MAASYPIPEGSATLLWAGEDPGFHVNLLEKLEAAGIPFRDRPIGDRDSAETSLPLPIDTQARFGFAVLVLSADLDAARAIFEALLKEGSKSGLELPGGGQTAPEWRRTFKNMGQEPTTEVWAGPDPKVAEFVVRALEENEIAVHLETAGELRSIYVGPANETRAKEIVREVREATPPD
jgi:hypothetical protein